MENIKSHPKYTKYGADDKGNVYNVKLNKKLHGSIGKDGRLRVTISKGETMLVSRFIYECFDGLIEDGFVIDHKDNNGINNNIENLQKITQQQNIIKKFTDGYDRTGVKMRPVESTNIETGEKINYRSVSGAGRVLNICSPSVDRVCREICHYATSRTNGMKYSFKYI